ncbi:MAG: HIT domain-containing protein [Phycisphaeraceae bacterium]|nr:MAG: HIT domain-containing protein [Phycisphaeraceae bacterium]
MAERDSGSKNRTRPGDVGGPGAPGNMPPSPSVLHAPWRDEYLRSLGDKEKEDAGAKKSGSFLAEYWRSPEHDERNHVIARVGEGAEAGMLLLNKYPYANGHLLIALGEPRPQLLDYSESQRAALWRLVDVGAALMERALEPQGLNIGVNEGRAAGAGVPEHLHVHLVPRWHGDVNFMTVTARVRVNPSALDVMAERYREAWLAMQGGGDAATT